MQYRSTRGTTDQTLSSSQAVIQGLANDGGLFVPVDFPKPNINLSEFVKLTYQEQARQVLGWFFDDYSAEQLDQIVAAAYGDQWDDQTITPVSDDHAGQYYLELFHGPTLAFKDVALQTLPHLMTNAIKLEKVDRKIVILTATSGDTGTASMCGFQDVDGTQVIVFYPHNGVAPIQLKQMFTQPGDNLNIVAVEGNFDDAQTYVKQIFNDPDFREQLLIHHDQFSSANSMNIGRLIPQITYYFNAYTQLVQREVIQVGDKVNFSVPTGNFGDILAGYYAKKLGLPINKLICASDSNNVLTDFFKTGEYDKRRDFNVTISPSMDILVSSNLERLLFDAADQDYELISQLMDQLTTESHYQLPAKVYDRLSDFAAGFASEDEIRAEIKRVFTADHYALDPHTAVGSYVAHQYQKETGDSTPMIVVATASPYKFPETVYQALNDHEVEEAGLPAIKQLEKYLQTTPPAGIQTVFGPDHRTETVVKPAEMKAKISDILDLN